MTYLFLAGESPCFGGYTIKWLHGRLSVADCCPRLRELRIYDWEGGRHCMEDPAQTDISWRIVDFDGNCVASHTGKALETRQKRWLTALDKRIEAGDVTAVAPGSSRILITARLDLELPDYCRALLEEAGNHLDYRLDLLGPDGTVLDDSDSMPRAGFRFWESSDAFLVPA